MIKNKQIKRMRRHVAIILLVVMLLATPVFAAEWDNVKSYNSNTKTVTIDNAFGFGDKIVDIKLLTPHRVVVWAGDNVKVAEFEVDLNSDDYDDAFDLMEFYDKKDNKKQIAKEFEYKIKTKDGWELFDYSKLTKGKITVGIFTDVKEGEITEWIPTFFGERIPEWAIFVGAEKIEFFDDSAAMDSSGALAASTWIAQNFTIGGVGTDQVWNVYGIAVQMQGIGAGATIAQVSLHALNSSGLPDLSNQLSTNISVDLETMVGNGNTAWINISMPNATLEAATGYAIIINQTDDNNRYQWRRDGSTPAYVFGQGLETGGGQSDWVETTKDYSFQLWGDTNTPPIVTLNYPDNNLNLTLDDVPFNCSATDTSQVNNITLYINGVSNFTATGSSTYLDINETIIDLETTANNWSCLAVDDENNGKWAAINWTVNIFDVFEQATTFSEQTTEGALENFQLNVSIDEQDTFVSANLNYNNTVLASTFINPQAFNYTATNLLVEVPGVPATINKTFFWSVNLGSGEQINTSLLNQTIKNLGMDDCSGFSKLMLNYSLLDEGVANTTLLNATPLQNTSIEVDVNIFPLGSSTTIINFSKSYDKINPAQVCLETDLNISYIMETTTSYTGVDYETEFHFFQDFVLNNNTYPQQIGLFDLLSSDSQDFEVTFKDVDLLPVKDAIIELTRFYVGDGVFRTVEMGKTDADGKTTLHFVTNDIIYTIIVKKDRNILATFDNVVARCQDPTISSCTIELKQIFSGTDPIDFQTFNNLDFSMVFNQVTKTITVTFSTQDGSSASVQLNGTKYDRFGNDTVCSDSVTSSSGTLNCIVPESAGNATIISKLYSDGALITTRFYTIAQDLAETLGGTRIVLLLMLVITIPLLFVSSTIGVVIGLIVGFIFASLLSLYEGGNVFDVGAAAMWLVIAGVIIIIRIRQRRSP